MKRLRKELRWALGLSLGLSAWALWPRPVTAPAVVQAAVERPSRVAVATTGVAAGLADEALPARLPELDLDYGEVDVFAPPPPPAPPPPAPVVAAPPPPAPPPAPPSLRHQYLGRMQTPDGQWLTLLAQGDQAVPVRVGDVLSDGYRVEAIEPTRIRLSYPSTEVQLELPIPSRNP